MKMTKLQKNRYEYYKLHRGIGGISAIECAKLAFGEFPKTALSPAAVLAKKNAELLLFMKGQADKMVRNATLINRVVKVCRRYNEPQFYASNGKVYISLIVRGLDSLKRGKLPRVLKAVERVAGVEFNSSSDYAELGNRDFSASSDLFAISVQAYLKDDPKACRKVQTGVERIEKPIYKIVCDD